MLHYRGARQPQGAERVIASRLLREMLPKYHIAEMLQIMQDW
jgi:hypothetical protein